MARSLPASLGKRAVTGATLLAVSLLASAVLGAQSPNSYILAARRSGAIEIIEPASLTTIGRIHFDLPLKSSGLNGVSASADGTMLYVQGPIPNEGHGCCVLYSIDLATLETRQVADITGTASRSGFFVADGITYHADSGGNPSSDGGQLFEVRSFRGPAVDIYDLAQGKIARTLVPSGLQGDWSPTGARLDDQFVLYAAKDDGSAARLWVISPKTTQLGEGTAAEPFGAVPNCHSPVLRGMATAAGNVFLYEIFGWKLDRRESCTGVPGGAWVLDPSTGTLLAQVASDFYFSDMVADREKGELYGISVGDPAWGSGVELVRINAEDGTILKSRALESDVWRIAFAPLRILPAADVRALISSKK